MRRRPQAGVTLMELMIAITLLSMISVGMLFALRIGLNAYSKAKTPVVEVAKAMKRTEGAVRQKAKTIGIGLGHRR